MNDFHRPVLLKETMEWLSVRAGEQYIDATVGGGGHTKEILKLKGRVLGIDCDPEAIEAAREALLVACPTPRHRGSKPSWQLVQGGFASLGEIARRQGFSQVAGILFDLGVSTNQLESPQRGFSFKADHSLDMRMDPELAVTAADLVNGLTKKELKKLFFELGGEQQAAVVAKAIVNARRFNPIKTGRELAEIIVRAKKEKIKKGKIHPATRCFQALRIAVNDELNNLRKALPQALVLLKPTGRLVVISFHSGEDKIVKGFLREMEAEKKIHILTKKPVCPSRREVSQNPRSRSAKLRAGEKN